MNVKMIKSFKHKGLEQFYLKGVVKGVNPNHAKKLSFILASIDEAEIIDDLNFPNFRLHPYKGVNLWSVDVSGNYRILFEFRNGNAYILDYLDPH
jgi:proteic killer suppression protein